MGGSFRKAVVSTGYLLVISLSYGEYYWRKMETQLQGLQSK